jgi:hypothetical protein
MCEKQHLASFFCRGLRPSVHGLAKQAIISFFILLLADHAIAQPQATLTCRPQQVPLNRSLEMTLELVWSGEADVYDIPQPDLSPLKEFEIVERSLAAKRENNKNKLRYGFVLKPLKRGEHDVSEMRVEYFEKGRDIAVAIPLPQTIVTVGKPELLSRRARIGIGAGLGTAAVIMAVLIAVRSKKKSRETQQQQTTSAARLRTDLLAELKAARGYRIEGDTSKYLEKLCTLGESEALRGSFRRRGELYQMLEDVKFGGRVLSPDELNWVEGLMKDAIKKAFPADSDETEEGVQNQGGREA